MKTFLAVDTAASYLTVAVRDRAGKIFLSHLPDCAMNHSVRLLEIVQKTLQDAGMAPSDCDFFACVTGAGSFTGIRIGIATVKGLCTAADRPALGVTSFSAVAYTTGRVKTLAVLSAGHGYYYICGFDEEKRVALPPAYRSYDEVAALAGEYTFASYEELPFPGALGADMSAGLVAAVLGESARGEGPGPCERLQAVYVRKSQAEENRR